jgi:hypothetical protein
MRIAPGLRDYSRNALVAGNRDVLGIRGARPIALSALFDVR